MVLDRADPLRRPDELHGAGAVSAEAVADRRARRSTESAAAACWR